MNATEEYLKKLSKSLNIIFIVDYEDEDILQELLVWLDAYQEERDMTLSNGLYIVDVELYQNTQDKDNKGKIIVSENKINSYEFDRVLHFNYDSPSGIMLIRKISEESLDKMVHKFDDKRWRTIRMFHSDAFQRKHAMYIEAAKAKNDTPIIFNRRLPQGNINPTDGVFLRRRW